MGELGCRVGMELWVLTLLLAESRPMRCLLCAYVFSRICSRYLLPLRFQILDFMERVCMDKKVIVK